VGTFASDKHALGECARCGVKMLLKHMLNDGYYPNLIVCPSCWEPRHPQESLPNVEDPVVLYRPAPENLPPPTSPVLTGGAVNTDFMFIVATDDGVTQWQGSVDGVTWVPIPNTGITNQVLWVPALSLWFAVGTTIQFSADGINWDTATATGLVLARDIAYSPSLNVLVVTDSGGTIWYSNDGGLNFQSGAGFTSQTFRGVQWDATIGLFVVVASAGNPSTQRVHTSPDGQNWTIRTINTQGWLDVTSNGALYIATHALSSILNNQQSSNGTAWSSAGTQPFNGGNIDFGLGLFMTTGFDGANNVVQRSASGTGSWTTTAVGSAATLGAMIQVRADPTRNQWWFVSRNQLHRSNDATGSAWSLATTGTNLTAIGVRAA
jgi:hypothetical protein